MKQVTEFLALQQTKRLSKEKTFRQVFKNLKGLLIEFLENLGQIRFTF